jgi:hypothetical protein
MRNKRNIAELMGYVRIAPDANQSRINNIIKWYSEGKIKNFNTASRVASLLASKDGRTIRTGKPIKEYNRIQQFI